MIGRAGAPVLAQALQLRLDLVEGARVEQLPQFLRAEELAEQVAVEGQRRGAPLGERSIALVHVDAHPPEEQRLRERRCMLGVDRHEARAARPEVRHDLAQRGDVEDVAEAFPRGFQQDREVRELRRLREEVRRALPLLPQGCALARSSPGEQQRSRGRLPEHAGEHGRLRHRLHHRGLDRIGIEQQLLGGDAVDGLRQPDHDPVVAPQDLGARPEPLEHPGLDRHRPRRVHARAERGQHTHPPVAHLVAEPLDHDGLVVRDRAGRLHLLLEVGHEVRRRELVEAHITVEPLQGGVASRAAERAGERAYRAAELDRTAGLVAVPERHPSLLAGRRRHDHPVARDVLDAPGRGTEHDHVASATLVHHLFVELADPRAVDQEDREQAAIGDRAARRDRDPAGAVTSPDGGGGPVPDDPGPELGEPVARVAPGEHVQHREVHVLRQLGERCRAADRLEELVDPPLLDGAHGDDLLGEHVEGVPQVARVLDLAGEHPLGHHGCLQQVTPELGEDASTRGLTHLVAGPADPLQPARDRPRRLHLDHQVHGAHVDAELEGGGGDDRAQPAFLQGVLDLEPLLSRERAVMRAHEVLLGELVQAGREALGQPSRVREDDGGSVRADQLQQRRMDRRPDRASRLPVAGAFVLLGSWGSRRPRVQGDAAAHVLHGHHDLELHRFAMPGVHDRHGPLVPVDRSSEEPRDLLERPLRGGQSDPLRRHVAELLEPLEGQGEMRAALRRRHRVDLVDDHGPHAPEGLAGGRSEHQVQRLRRGDQDVGRAPDQALPIPRRRVAAADRDHRRVGERCPEPVGRVLDPGEGGAEVLLDVDRERTQG